MRGAGRTPPRAYRRVEPARGRDRASPETPLRGHRSGRSRSGRSGLEEARRRPSGARRPSAGRCRAGTGDARKLRQHGGGYRRDHLRAFAQRVEVGDGHVRIMGSKGELLRTLTSVSSGKSAGIAVPTLGLKWRKGWDSNPRWACTHGGFQDRCLKPLGHPSAGGCGCGRASRAPSAPVSLTQSKCGVECPREQVVLTMAMASPHFRRH